jgi:predicted aldo/keto reductase-like oxidoreductase
LGMGCMRLPRLDPNEEKIDRVQTQKMVDYAIAHGVNYFDTAYMYHRGESEKVIGPALSKYPRDSYHLVSKMPGWLCKTEEDVRKIFQKQLDRCGVDYFDFYLCHNLSEDFEPYYYDEKLNIINVLEEFRAEGKIKYLGFSSHAGVEVLEKFAKHHPWDFAQIQLNYLDWEYQDAKRQYEILTELGLPVVVMEPVRGGRLANLCPEANALLQEQAPDKSLASWAIRFAASHENVLTVLSGMSDMAQMQDNIATIENFQPITEEERELLFKAAGLLREKALVPCTGCRYCNECPKELDIPALISIYNEYELGHNVFNLADVNKFEEARRPDQCIGCGQCAEHCPQKIKIPEVMEDLARIVREKL